MLRNTILIFTLLLSQLAFAQDNGEKVRKMKADKLYNVYAFEESLRKYEALQNKTPEILRKLAKGYMNIRDFKKSEEYYARLAKSSDKTPTDVYNYAYVLAMNEKYPEYADQMNAYHAMRKTDNRAALFSVNNAFYKDLLINKGVFELKTLDFNSDKQDFGTAYYKDKIVFASSGKNVSLIKMIWTWNKKPFLDLYVADVDSGGYQLSGVKKFAGKKLNKKFHEGPASFNKEGTFMAFTRNNYNYSKPNEKTIVKLELFFSEWKDGSWTSPVAFAYNDANYSVGHPSLTEDGKTMYFASDMPGGYGGVDLYVSHKNASGEWSRPQNLGKKINTEGNEMFPFISDKGILFFASNGLPGLGGLDIFYTKATDDGDYQKPRNAGMPVNGSKDDFGMIVSFKSKTGYFSSGRESGKGNDDIYAFRLLKDLNLDAILKGKAVDEKGVLLADSKVELFNNTGKLVKTVTTDKNGTFQFAVTPDIPYKLKGSKNEYFDAEEDLGKITDERKVTLVLEHQPDYEFFFKTLDSETEKPLSGVVIAITDNKKSKQTKLTSNSNGNERYELPDYKYKDNLNFSMVLRKKGYLTESVIIQKTLDKKAKQTVTARMQKIEVGKDLGKMLKLKDIYFDLGKWDIRPDAALELDKIVSIMNENPTMRIELSSHTDCRGSARFNRRLSDKRAKSSADYIRKRISHPYRIYGKGYGESRLVNDCACEGNRGKGKGCTEEEHQENRRTEFKILKN